MTINEIWIWTKDAGFWIWENKLVTLLIFIAILIIIWIIKKLITDIRQ